MLEIELKLATICCTLRSRTTILHTSHWHSGHIGSATSDWVNTYT